jgi:hypothetical protein
VSECLHLEFEARVDVLRLTKIEGGPATGYTADVQIRCKRCKIPFRFKGLPTGSYLNSPSISVCGEELRAPIEPAPGAPTWENNAELRRVVLGE